MKRHTRAHIDSNEDRIVKNRTEKFYWMYGKYYCHDAEQNRELPRFHKYAKFKVGSCSTTRCSGCHFEKVWHIPRMCDVKADLDLSDQMEEIIESQFARVAPGKANPRRWPPSTRSRVPIFIGSEV